MYERSVDAARRGVRAYSDVLRRLLRARVVSFSKTAKGMASNCWPSLFGSRIVALLVQRRLVHHLDG